MRSRLSQEILSLIRGKDIAQSRATASVSTYAEASDKKKDVRMFVTESRVFRL